MKTLNELQDDVIDSRDLIEAVEDWESHINDLENDEPTDDTPRDLEDAREALEELKDFCKPFEGCADWEHGETLISESYFTDYCEELLKDCGYIPNDIPEWIVLDFEQTAENMKVDYMNDNDYFMRCV